ncbi:hypothetical protein ARALYDRAFT_470423, partial [Arabidopsis lyrata subsp. lyrata]
MAFSNPQECAICKRVFLSSHHLISHFNDVHSNRHGSTFSSSAIATPTSFRHYPNVNRNPNPDFQARNHFDVNYYRRGYLDDHGRFHKGCSPTPVITPTRKYKFLLPKMPTTPKLMDLFPTLPLIWQLEQRRAEDSAVTENGGANSSSIDLSLRL